MADERERKAMSSEGAGCDTEAHSWRGPKHEEPKVEAEDKAASDNQPGEGAPDPNARSSYRGV